MPATGPPYAREIHDLVPHIDPRHNLKDAAKGKTILITGGGGGCGKAMAEQFALAGASTVVVTGRTVSALEKTKADVESKVPGCSVLAVAADVTVEESVDALFGQLPRTPDVLVNNSGTVLNLKPIAESDPAEWWMDVSVSLKGTYLCSRAYLRLLDGKPGTILNVSSGACDNVSDSISAYGTAKLAQCRFTEFVHHEYAKQGVRCIAFSPGSIASTGIGQRSPPQFLHFLIDTVDLAGGFAVYLSTDAAAFLAGRYVVSNWPMEKLEEMKEEVIEQNLLVARMRFGDNLSNKIVIPDETEQAKSKN